MGGAEVEGPQIGVRRELAEMLKLADARSIRAGSTVYPAWCWRCRAVRNATPGPVWSMRLKCSICGTWLEYRSVVKEEEWA